MYCHHFVATRCDKSYCERGGYSMKKALSLVLVAVFLVSLFGGLSVVPSAKAVAQEVTYNLGAEPATIDPALTVDLVSRNIALQVFEGLTLSLIHISEPTRLGMISYAVFCLKKKKKQ